MINICSKGLWTGRILKTFVIDDVLYILYYYIGEDMVYMKLLKFCMIKRYVIDDIVMSTKCQITYIYNISILNNKIHFLTDMGNNMYTHDIFELDGFKEKDNINKYINWSSNLMFRADLVIDNTIYCARESIFTHPSKRYKIVNFYSGEALLTIDYSESNSRDVIKYDEKENTFYLPHHNRSVLRYNNGYLILYIPDGEERYEKCIIYNLTDRTYRSCAYKINTIMMGSYILYSEGIMNNESLYIRDVLDDYKYLLPQHLHNSNHIDIIHYNDNKYLIAVKNGFLDIYVMYDFKGGNKGKSKKGKSKKIDAKFNKHITIGTSSNSTSISLKQLFRRSSLIKDLYSDIGEVPDTLIHESYANIDVYKKFITTNKVNNSDLYALYKICNYLNDIDINYVSELILSYVKENNVNIKKSFKFLELLSTSLCDNQLNALLYIIMQKYDRGDIYNNIMEYKDTKLYDFALKQLFTTAYESVSKFK